MAKGKEESGHPKDEDCSLPMRLPKYEAKFDQKSFYNEYGLPLLDWSQLRFIFPMIYRISVSFWKFSLFISGNCAGGRE